MTHGHVTSDDGHSTTDDISVMAYTARAAAASTLRRVWGWYRARLEHAPWTTNALTAACVTATGDAIAQRVERYLDADDANSDDADESESALDTTRTLSMFAWGVCTGPPMYAWYRWLDRRMPIPRAHSRLPVPAQLALKIALNQTTFAVAMNVGFFAWCTAFPNGLSVRLPADFRDALLDRLQRDMPDTTRRSIALWSVVHAVNFTFVPPQVRVLYQSSVGVFWQAYLSWIGHRAGENEDVAAVAQQQEQQQLVVVVDDRPHSPHSPHSPHHRPHPHDGHVEF